MAKFAIFLILFSFQALGWGPKGQEITVLIAENYLTQEARKEINELLGPNVQLSKFSTWADQVRSSEEWQHTSGWHYINVEDSALSITDPDDVSGAIEYCINQLNSDLPHSEKVTWLKFLIHFLGDIHQPMHIGKPQDRGGNSTIVSYGKEMNLHYLWDSALIDRQSLSVNAYVMKITSQNRSKVPLQKSFSLDEVVNEGFLMRKFMYSFRNRTIDGDYEKQAISIIDERLWTGGLRLAQVLNKLYQ